MFDVVNTFVVIEINKGKMNTIAIDNPIKFVVPNLFFKFLMFLVFKLFINFYSVKVILILNYFLPLLMCRIFGHYLWINKALIFQNLYF